MQVLKNEVRQRILQSAKKEFAEKSFEKASMRIISNDARMTVGNLYRYYENKESLFGAIVAPLYDQLRDLETQLPQESKARLVDLLKHLEMLNVQYNSEWYILFNGSIGTCYRKAVVEIQDVLKNALHDILKRRKGCLDIAAPLASAVIQGLTHIAQSGKSGQDGVEGELLTFMLGQIL